MKNVRTLRAGSKLLMSKVAIVSGDVRVDSGKRSGAGVSRLRHADALGANGFPGGLSSVHCEGNGGDNSPLGRRRAHLTVRQGAVDALAGNLVLSSTLCNEKCNLCLGSPTPRGGAAGTS